MADLTSLSHRCSDVYRSDSNVKTDWFYIV